ncbi:MAG: NMD3-related protein [Candidatus Micrarchaeia archaeon]
MPKYCPICNRSSDKFEFYGAFCEVCSREKLSKKIPNDINVLKCKRCGRIKLAGSFVEENRLSIAEEIKKSLKGLGVKVEAYDEHAGIATAIVTEIISGKELRVEKQISIKHIDTLCQQCARKAGGYYEAVLQLRGDFNKIAKIERSVANFLEANDEFISKELDVENGVDVYVSSKKLAAAMISGMRLKANKSYTLYSIKNGKKIYRNTYAIYL